MKLNDQIQSIPKEEFNILKKFVKRSNDIQGIKSKDLIYFSYGFVKIDLPNLLETADFEEIFISLVPKVKINKLNIQKAMPFIFWVYDSLKNIIAIEREYLSSTPKLDLISAGIERLNELGELNTLDAVASRFNYKMEEIKEKPYHEVFDLQRRMKLEADIQEDLARIQKDRSKQKKLH